MYVNSDLDRYIKRKVEAGQREIEITYFNEKYIVSLEESFALSKCHPLHHNGKIAEVQHGDKTIELRSVGEVTIYQSGTPLCSNEEIPHTLRALEICDDKKINEFLKRPNVKTSGKKMYQRLCISNNTKIKSGYTVFEDSRPPSELLAAYIQYFESINNTL